MQSKKTIRNPFGIFGWPVLLLVILILGFAPAVDQKKLKFEFTIDETNAILYCLDKSNAEHTTVMAVTKLIADQAKAQLDAEKKIADSLNKVPPKKN